MKTSTTSTPIKVYAYTRVSTEMQVDKYSLDAQLDRIKEYCKIRNFTIIHHYSDEGKSGKTTEGRDSFNEMMTSLSTNPEGISYILVFKLSRFGRNTLDILNSLKFLQKHNVNLICIEDGLDTSNNMATFMITMMAAVAEVERENILTQTQAGRVRKASEGKWNGGPAPYGYILSNGSLLVDPPRAELVRKIYDLYIENPDMGLVGVANYLNQHGYQKDRTAASTQQSAPKAITTHFVKVVLDNPIYAGLIAYGRRTVDSNDTNPNRKQPKKVKQEEEKIVRAEGIHEAIIPLEVWNIAHEKRLQTGKKTVKKDPNHYYILSTLLRCPSCNSPLYGIPASKKLRANGNPYDPAYYYRCKHGSLSNGGVYCSKPIQISAKKVDAEVREFIIKVVNSPQTLKKLQELVSEKTDDDALKRELEQVEGVYTKNEARIEAFSNDEMELDPTDRYYSREKDRLRTQIETLYKKQDELIVTIEGIKKKIQLAEEGKVNKKVIVEILANYDRLYDKLSDLDKQTLMRRFIDHIDLNEDKGKETGHLIKAIHFKFPVYYDNKMQKTIFLPKEKHDETVCLLVLRNPVTHVNIDVDVEELVQDKRGQATYEQIRDYVKEQTGLHVTNLNIAQIKRKCRIIERENYNLPKSEDSKQPNCTKEKENAIKEAFKHFGMI